MNTDIKNLDLDISLILARVYKSLKLRKGFSLEILENDFTKDDMTFFPRLILSAAQGPKGITNKIRTLAVLIQVIYLSTEIHNQIPEQAREKNQFEKEIQLPILVGDFLYSKFFDILCEEDCIEYLDDFIHFISELNLGWINYLENKLPLEEVCKLWYGELASLAMGLSSSSSGINNNLNNIIKEYGFTIGYMYGVKKLNLPSIEYEKSWNKIKNTLNKLPYGKTKDALTITGYSFYELSHDDIVINTSKLSAVAEH